MAWFFLHSCIFLIDETLGFMVSFDTLVNGCKMLFGVMVNVVVHG